MQHTWEYHFMVAIFVAAVVMLGVAIYSTILLFIANKSERKNRT